MNKINEIIQKFSRILKAGLFKSVWEMNKILAVSFVLFSVEICYAELALNCGKNRTLLFSEKDGSLVALEENGTRTRLASSKLGLWAAEGERGNMIACASRAKFSWNKKNDSDYIFHYTHPKVNVTLHITGNPDGYADFKTSFTSANGTEIRAFQLPAKTFFDLKDIKSVIMPDGGLYGFGLEFLPSFFQKTQPDNPRGWQLSRAGDQQYAFLFGSLPDYSHNERQNRIVQLNVTEEGKKIFPQWLVTRINEVKRMVNRAPGKNQADTILVDSPDGAFFSGFGFGFGGNGRLWQFGSWQRYGDVEGYVRDIPKLKKPNIFLEPVIAVIEHQIQKDPDREIALIELAASPNAGPRSSLTITMWQKRMEQLREKYPSRKIFSIKNIPELKRALAEPRNMIINPYGEAFPVANASDAKPMLKQLRDFVVKGGHWFETSGLPFWWCISPKQYLERASRFGSSFADFIGLRFAKSPLSIYSVQPMNYEPWAGKQDISKIFVPAEQFCGGSAEGGWISRKFFLFSADGQKCDAPAVRFRFASPEESLEAFNHDNLLNRTLADKLPADLFEKLKIAVMYKMEGFCYYYGKNLRYIPYPGLIHYDRHLLHGYDKGYPDQQPCNEKIFGTHEEYREFIHNLRAQGHLLMPYSNSTFWGERPRSETFKREGNAGLVRIDRAGKKLRWENYTYTDKEKGGYPATMWHPVIRKANARTVTQFSKEYPCDILFQDQYGARPLPLYDFNAASPTPYAVIAGYINQTLEDSKRIPIATEGGLSHLMNSESMFFGLGFGVIPTRQRGSEQKDYNFIYPTESWRLYPLIQRLGHDKVILRNHNHQGFDQYDRSLSVTLAIGFSINYNTKKWGAFSYGLPEEQAWTRYLAAVQREVVGPTVGKKLVSFEHIRQHGNNAGYIRAQYGETVIIANLDPEALDIEGVTIMPYGYYAYSKTMRAGFLQKIGEKEFPEGCRFVSVNKNKKVYITVCGKPGTPAGALMPWENSWYSFSCADGIPAKYKQQGDAFLFNLHKGRMIPAGTRLWCYEYELKPMAYKYP